MRPWRLMSLVLVLVGTLAAPAAAGPGPVDSQGAALTVMEQLEAFRRDDYERAYGFASAMIRDIFDRPAFERMVRDGYPEIARSTSAAITGSFEAPGGRLYLTIVVRGASGLAVEALYEMVRQDGHWRINGVVTRPAPPSI
jgi:hypothetical protein